MKKYFIIALLCSLFCLVGCMNQEEKDKKLVEALNNQNVQEVQKWLNKKANPNVVMSIMTEDLKEIRPLLMSVYQGNLEIAKLLLEAGADVNARVGEEKVTALILASGRYYNVQIMKLLLEAGADPNLPDYNDVTPLLYTCFLPGDDINAAIETLLKAKADPNIRNNDGITALMVAVANGYTGAVKLLLEAKADPNVVSKYNQSPLILASEMDNNEIVKILLRYGANPNGNMDSSWKKKNVHELLASFKNSNEHPLFTPLIHASYRGNIELVDILLRSGANPNVPDSNMNTPLLFAASSPSNNRFKIAEMLLKAGADINYFNSSHENKTAYEFAAEKSDLQMMKLLKKYGADDQKASKMKSSLVRKLLFSKDGGVKILQ